MFEPAKEHPAKRRRVGDTGLQKSWHLRQEACNGLWAQQEHAIEVNTDTVDCIFASSRPQEVLSKVDAATVESIRTFVTSTSIDQLGLKLPTGLVIAGPSIASHGQFFDNLAKALATDACSTFVKLTSGEAANLKNLLKTLIKKATSRNPGLDEDEDEDRDLVRQKGPKLLNYDLQTLYNWSKEQSTDRVIVAFQDSEAFDGALLAETVELLHSWLDRIPFVLLFGIATSIENFRDKLPRSAIRCLEGAQFDVVRTDEVLEHVFQKTIGNDDIPIWLGPSLCGMLLDRQKDHIQSVQASVDALKYAYMSHFYANPLSMFLQKDVTFKNVPKDHFEATRNLPSFRRYAEDCLELGEGELVRSMLQDDQSLFEQVIQNLTSGQQVMHQIVDAVELLFVIRSHIPRIADLPRSALYVKAAAGELDMRSSMMRDLLLSVKKSSSDVLSALLEDVVALNDKKLSSAVKNLQAQLKKLLDSSQGTSTPLRSEHDLHHSTLRTTVVAQKVELRKQKSNLSKKDSAYSELLKQFYDLIEIYFSDTLINPKDLFLHEVFLYDLKSPHRDVFMPKPRFAIERALSAPHDYLDCECCVPAGERLDEATLSFTQPATAILYQLYLESGSLINVSDLWSAFNAILNDDGDGDEAQMMALFQRSLAELKYMGFIKSSRKKADHVAKVTWKGL
ncbi:Origin recognition complex subunit 3 [Cryomyces antarcticus]|nr:Origin recognition complex subunit 3 [Cryomyces antarcticus]